MVHCLGSRRLGDGEWGAFLAVPSVRGAQAAQRGGEQSRGPGGAVLPIACHSRALCKVLVGVQRFLLLINQ